MAVETEGTLVVGLATLASGVEGGALGGGEVTGSSVDDTGGTWVKCPVDKAGALFAGLAEDDIAKILVKPTTTNIYFTTRSAGGEN